jgi:hypothetical protein
MSIIYALVGTNRVPRHSNSNNSIVIGDFNSFRFFGDTLYSNVLGKAEKHYAMSQGQGTIFIATIRNANMYWLANEFSALRIVAKNYPVLRCIIRKVY